MALPLLVFHANRLHSLPDDVRIQLLLQAVDRADETEICQILDSLTRTDHALHEDQLVLRAVLRALQAKAQTEEYPVWMPGMNSLPTEEAAANMSVRDLRRALIAACLDFKRIRLVEATMARIWELVPDRSDNEDYDEVEFIKRNIGGVIGDGSYEALQWLREQLNDAFDEKGPLTADQLFNVMRRIVEEYEEDFELDDYDLFNNIPGQR